MDEMHWLWPQEEQAAPVNVLWESRQLGRWQDPLRFFRAEQQSSRQFTAELQGTLRDSHVPSLVTVACVCRGSPALA